jgi:hypothetical protein
MKDVSYDYFFNSLINQPLWDIRRACDIIMFYIGEPVNVKSRLTGEEFVASSFALHAECAWRMVDTEKRKILLASNDLFQANSSTEINGNFDWDVQGCNLFDEKSKKWVEENAPVHIKDFSFSVFGDLALFFSNGNALRIFVNISESKDCWRIFESDSDKPHFVVNGRGYGFGM